MPEPHTTPLSRAEILDRLRRRTEKQRDACRFMASYHQAYREPKANVWRQRAREEQQILAFLSPLVPAE